MLTKDILFEIGMEEVPAHVMPHMLEELKTLAQEKLREANLTYQKIATFGTPRRATLYIQNVPVKQKSSALEKRGPSLLQAFDEKKEPTKALLGFARKMQVQLEDLLQKDGYIYALIKEEGKDTIEILKELLPSLLTNLHFKNHMRWADIDFKFIRPIRFMVALFGTDIIDFTVARVKTGRLSRGHRIFGKKEIEIPSPAEYVEKLRENFVIVKGDERRAIIKESIINLAKKHQGTPIIDEDLLEEVTYLVEYPSALIGTFEEKYLRLVEPAIITPMKDHQRYFPLRDKEGKLMAFFITIRDGNKENLTLVQKGNERVLRARLADAEFFFLEDKKTTLSEKRLKLKKLVFQEHLGTMFDKSERLIKIVEKITPFFTQATEDQKHVKRAAYLAKSDLVSAMVTEFTELEGTMGKEYALLEGEDEKVALALEEAYLPRFVGDKNPTTTIGQILSLADKIDTIAALFSQNLMPTGSADPFALRRKTLGIIHLLIKAKISINLLDIAAFVLDLLQTSNTKRKETLAQIQEFTTLRLKNMLLEEGTRYDVIDAVFLSQDREKLDIYQTHEKILALEKFVQKAENQESIEAFCRVLNLSSKVATKDQSSQIQTDLLQTIAEKKLYEIIQYVQENVVPSIEKHDYLLAIRHMQKLQEPINEFFDQVMVMDKNEEIRKNRLLLLKNIECILGQIADFSKLVL